ncbi:acetyltransferase (GNAT) family protein [Ureibacillus xyleni]|uniref:Acetyltransferase (GNAT) family protein n=1 Tax=Ureibacillus xyleni TaxID=614648 RepID=A0A285TA46_9BACL|nr:GNAT family N-acetyltransferase [Ureibacillus xyleni]SOC18258.1 acetyltransferase (GNAT) family protein [Ureibacillus xyleni]
MEIRDVQDIPERFNDALELFWGYWGQEKNKPFYEQCMKYANGPDGIPRFFVAIIEGQLVGTYALLRNDINSRHDLYPWFACLYVKDEHRGKGIAANLLRHGEVVAQSLGFKTLYLESNLDGFYEKLGWIENGITYDPFGNSSKIYEKVLEEIK